MASRCVWESAESAPVVSVTGTHHINPASSNSHGCPWLLVFSRDRGASSSVSLLCFKRIDFSFFIYVLFSKEGNLAEGAHGTFLHFCLSLPFLSPSCSCPICSHSLRLHLGGPHSKGFHLSLTLPVHSQSFCNISFQVGGFLLTVHFCPSCANLYNRSVKNVQWLRNT
jgi:hypothetical protein